jgi:hypothetical protein
MLRGPASQSALSLGSVASVGPTAQLIAEERLFLEQGTCAWVESRQSVAPEGASLTLTRQSPCGEVSGGIRPRTNLRRARYRMTGVRGVIALGETPTYLLGKCLGA